MASQGSCRRSEGDSQAGGQGFLILQRRARSTDTEVGKDDALVWDIDTCIVDLVQYHLCTLAMIKLRVGGIEMRGHISFAAGGPRDLLAELAGGDSCEGLLFSFF